MTAKRLVLTFLTLFGLVALWRVVNPPEAPLVVTPRALLEAAPMCPWRQPEADMRAFFPGATGYRTETLILTNHLRELQKRLGRRPTPDENPLYVHRVLQGSQQIGSVLVRRVKGEFGAIEIVLAVKDGTVAGLRLQRLREPAPIAQALNSSWLHSFVGKTVGSSWQDAPPVPAAARVSAAAVVEGARSLLILHEVGTQRGTINGPALRQ